MKIYVASSWRNDIQPQVVESLKNEGHEVYDFKNPKPGNHGFHWSEIDPEWKTWPPEKFRKALSHPVAEAGFSLDMQHLYECDVCILVLSSGRSAHLEAGYCIGAGKPTIILLTEDQEPELMYKMATAVCVSIDEVVDYLRIIDDMDCQVYGCTRNTGTLDKIDQIIEECELTEQVAQSVCKHFQYCGNNLLANGEVDEFICRKHMLEHNRHDKMQMIIPYTNTELQECLRKFCKYHFVGCQPEGVKRDA